MTEESNQPLLEENISDISALHKDELHPEVRSYTDNLQEQIQKGFESLGIKNQKEFDEVAEKEKIPVQEFGRIQKLMEKLLTVSKTGEIPTEDDESAKILKAKEIMGEDFFGIDEVRKTFGEVELDEIPPLQFSEEELKRAKELGQFLILRIDKAPDGESLTMKKMEELLQPEFDQENKGEIFFNTTWCINEDFFIKNTPKPKWALVSKEIIPNSTSKNFLKQTQLIADYFKNEIFKDQTLPEEYREAIDEFESKKDEIESIISSNSQEAATKLSELKLNILTRQTPVEVLYDVLVYFKNKDKRLLENRRCWTYVRSSNGYPVGVGSFDPDGISVSIWYPDDYRDNLGVCFSR